MNKKKQHFRKLQPIGWRLEIFLENEWQRYPARKFAKI